MNPAKHKKNLYKSEQILILTERVRLYTKMIADYKEMLKNDNDIDIAGYPVITFKNEVLELSIQKLDALLANTLDKIFELKGK